MINTTTIRSSLNVVGDINSSGLSVFNINENLNSLSSYSFLNISGISNNLNSLSTYSSLNISNLQTTSTSLLNMINSLTGSSIITNLNNLSTYSSLNISNLQATTNTIFYKTNFSNLVVSNASTLLSSLNVSGITTLNNTNVNGIGNIHNGSPWAVTNNKMQSGSLTIGGTTSDYGLNTNAWTDSNVAGLLLECLNNTEIAVYDSGNRLVYLIAYQGNTTNSITIGRNMGEGAISSVVINGNIIGSGTALTNLYYNSILSPPSLISSNNSTTLISTLNVSGITTLSNNVVCNSSLQSLPKI